jgi:hypothetical protein
MATKNEKTEKKKAQLKDLAPKKGDKVKGGLNPQPLPPGMH